MMKNEGDAAELKDSGNHEILLTAFLVVILVVLGTLPFYVSDGPFEFTAGASTTLLGAYLLLWSVLVTISIYHPRKILIFRAIHWLATHAIVPRTRWNAYFLSAAFLLLGGYVILIGGGAIET